MNPLCGEIYCGETECNATKKQQLLSSGKILSLNMKHSHDEISKHVVRNRERERIILNAAPLSKQSFKLAVTKMMHACLKRAFSSG